ncbi:hypothetical protein D3C76_791800 [compost metagenome]
MRHAFGVADQAKCLRADGHTGQQVAEHGAQLQALGQGDGDDCGKQKDHRSLQKAAFVWHWLLLHELPGQRLNSLADDSGECGVVRQSAFGEKDCPVKGDNLWRP